MKHRVLELYSGIGGMHYALKRSGVDGEVVAAVDINTSANLVYHHNLPAARLLNRNIESFTAEVLNALNPDVILMSPPCQPFTRNGLRKDAADPRTDSFQTLIRSFRDVPGLEYVLVENVKGFEVSEMRRRYVEAMIASGFHCAEFMLTPSQFGIPNSRLRYYCLARRKPFSHPEMDSKLMYKLPGSEDIDCHEIEKVMEADLDDTPYLLSSNQLKKAFALDLRYVDSRGSCCFTKAYGHFLEGTGSIYSSHSRRKVEEVFESLDKTSAASQEALDLLLKLKLRFFTPKEISKLMCFPDSFQFPPNMTNRQCYKLLGNSINVEVVSKAIDFLINSS